MPYIPNEERPEYDVFINTLAELIVAKTIDKNLGWAGHYNYVATSLLLKVLELVYGAISYGSYALADGVIDTMKDEFQRRVGHKYEDKKWIENGDVGYDRLLT